MAWTAPRTYVAEEVVTAAIVNSDLRDNLLVLSTHAHSGAAGMGNDELAGVDSIAFDDLAASPSAAGELQRNGVNLEWYGAAVVAVTEADAAAGTASPRTLGTGAQQAAAGDHGHTRTFSSAATGRTNHGSATVTSSETDIVSLALTPGATARAWVVSGGIATLDAGATITLRLYYDAEVLETRTGIETQYRVWALQGIKSGPTVASHTVKITGQKTAGSDLLWWGAVQIEEVAVALS